MARIPVSQLRDSLKALASSRQTAPALRSSLFPQAGVNEGISLNQQGMGLRSTSLGKPTLPSALPVEGRISQGFGVPQAVKEAGEAIHGGVDIAIPTGTPIPEIAGGVVLSAGKQGEFGNSVVVRGKDGKNRRYSHLSTINVKPGQRIDRGGVVGLSGSSGVSTGPHLDFREYTSQ